MIWPLVTRYAFDADPFQEVDRWFTGYPATRSRFPALSLWVGSDEAVVLAQVPGIDPKEVSLTLTGDLLTLEGKREAGKAEASSYQRHERDYGTFSRSVRLPFEVDASKVTANGENGVLRITLPRSEASKPRKISINS